MGYCFFGKIVEKTITVGYLSAQDCCLQSLKKPIRRNNYH